MSSQNLIQRSRDHVIVKLFWIQMLSRNMIMIQLRGIFVIHLQRETSCSTHAVAWPWVAPGADLEKFARNMKYIGDINRERKQNRQRADIVYWLPALISVWVAAADSLLCHVSMTDYWRDYDEILQRIITGLMSIYIVRRTASMQAALVYVGDLQLIDADRVCISMWTLVANQDPCSTKDDNGPNVKYRPVATRSGRS